MTRTSSTVRWPGACRVVDLGSRQQREGSAAPSRRAPRVDSTDVLTAQTAARLLPVTKRVGRGQDPRAARAPAPPADEPCAATRAVSDSPVDEQASELATGEINSVTAH